MSAKKQLKFTKRFFQRLVLVEEYIALDNPTAAKQVAQYIYDAAENLEEFPLVGKAVGGGRELVLDKYPYTILYRVTSTAVIIRSVVHQAMVLRRK